MAGRSASLGPVFDSRVVLTAATDAAPSFALPALLQSHLEAIQTHTRTKYAAMVASLAPGVLSGEPF
jgi:hypothetical protein